MREFKPALPYTVAAEILKPVTVITKGVEVKQYPEHGDRINISFKTFGGTESVTNGLMTVIDTGRVETWYRPDITAACRLRILETGKTYEVLGTPEDIDARHMFMQIRVQAVNGGA